MNERKVNSQGICDGSSSFGSTSIRTNNNTLFVARNLLLDILLQERPSIKIVNRYVEEALVLGIMQVHCNDMVGASTGEKVSNKRTGLCNPFSVAWTRLKGVLSVVRLGRCRIGFFVILDTVGHGGRRLPALASVVFAESGGILSVAPFWTFTMPMI